MQSSYWSKIRYWISGTGSSWNKYDLSGILLFLLSVILRFSVPAPQFAYVRVSYGLMIVLFYVRFLQFYFAHRTIGPKVIIINRMFNDLLFFLCIFFVFIFAYGSFIQAILYPNKEPSISVLRDIIRFPFWQTFGDLNLEYFKGNTSCTPGARGCGVQSPLVEVAGGLYILSVNILLVNLLIAIFGHTFSTVHETSEKVWAFYRFGLVQEFQERPPLPPPFILISLLIMYFLQLCKLCCKCGKTSSNPFRFQLSAKLDNKVAQFEDNCAHMFHAKEEEAEENLVYERMKIILQQLQQLQDPRVINSAAVDPSRNGILAGDGKLLSDIFPGIRASRESKEQMEKEDEKFARVNIGDSTNTFQ
jgi:disulfide bond formation protein DsbB